eukprot:c15051_g1_i2 orf=130-846(+)
MLRQARATLSGVAGNNHRWRPLCQQRRVDEDEKKGREEIPPWLLVGVGNPGSKFLGTRHNVGFEMVDAVLKVEGIIPSTIRHNAIIGEGTIKGLPVVLAKPQTYANLIGESVSLLSKYYGVPAEKIIVLFDDMETRVAKLRLLAKGGHLNHKGLINMIAHLQGNRNFPRLRIGIGSPPEKMDPKAYVLQKFCEQERQMLDNSIMQGVEIIRLVVSSGVEKAIEGIPGFKKCTMDLRIL